jgi:hypothetical protein
MKKAQAQIEMAETYKHEEGWGLEEEVNMMLQGPMKESPGPIKWSLQICRE